MFHWQNERLLGLKGSETHRSVFQRAEEAILRKDYSSSSNPFDVGSEASVVSVGGGTEQETEATVFLLSIWNGAWGFWQGNVIELCFSHDLLTTAALFRSPFILDGISPSVIWMEGGALIWSQVGPGSTRSLLSVLQMSKKSCALCKFECDVLLEKLFLFGWVWVGGIEMRRSG